MYYSQLENSLWAPQVAPELGFALPWNTSKDWDKARLHLMMIFPVQAVTKMVSLSHSSIYCIIKKQFGDDVFVDICFLPPSYQLKAYTKQYPLLLGGLSKRSWHDFDILGLSVSVMWMDTIEFYKMAIQSEFPLHHKDRLDDGVTPLLITGGTSVDISAGLDSITDIYSIGYGERLFKWILDEGVKIKQAYPSQFKRHKQEIIYNLKDRPGICYPTAYHEDWHIQDGKVVCEGFTVDKGFPEICKPDMMLPISQYGYLYDEPPWWQMPGYIRKSQTYASYGCSGALGACNFCHEGHTSGQWSERSYEELNRALYVNKRNNVSDSHCFASFNSHNLTRFPELIKDTYKYFNKLSVINFRLSGLANSIRLGGIENNYVRLVRELGTTTLAGACEGINQRMRNLLNKSLSFEDIKIVMTEAFRNRFLLLKIGLIRTGYERKSDIDDMIKEWREILDIRDFMGAGAGIRMNMTSLIHERGTPCEMLPRVISYRTWMSSIDPGYYSYDFLPLSDMGIRIKVSNELYNVYMQQLQADLPSQLVEEGIMQTSLDLDKMTPAHGKLCNAYMESKGIDLKKQFLEYDFSKGIHQYIQSSPSQPIFSKQGTDWLKQTHAICLKMVDNYVIADDGVGLRNPVPTCHGCVACSNIDKSFKEHGVTCEQITGTQFKNYRDWIKNREVQHEFNLMDIRDMKIASEPSHFYRFIFKVYPAGRYVAKEGLVRGWFSALSHVNDKWVLGFRKIMWAGFRLMDNEGFYSMYHGYEAVTVGTTLDLSEIDEADFKSANALCPTIKMVRWSQIYESLRGPGVLRYLVELLLKVPMEDINTKIIPVFKSGQFNIYKQTVGLIDKEVRCSLAYKILPSPDGYKIYLLMPPRFSPALALVKAYTYNKLIDKFVSCEVKGIFSSIKDSSSYEDLVNDRIVDMKGFIVIKAADSLDEDDESDAPDLDGS
jgi:hypothetical protein